MGWNNKEIILKINMSSIWAQLSYYLRWSDAVEQTEVTWPKVTSVTWPEVTLSGRIFCACATRSTALVGPFDRKCPCPEVCSAHAQPEVTKSTWPEVGSAHARLFLPRFLISNSNMATQGHLNPFGVSLSVRNRKLRSTRSDLRSRDPRRKCPWGVLYDVRVLKS